MMHIRLSRSAARRWIAGLVLAAVAIRSLIPAGFMPVPGRLLSLEICPDGLPASVVAALGGGPGHGIGMAMPMPMPMPMDAQAHAVDPHAHEMGGQDDAMGGRIAHEHSPADPDHRHFGHRHPGDGSPHLEHCLFGGGSAAAPVPHEGSHGLACSADPAVAVAFAPQRIGGFPAYVPPSRGPPLSL